MTNLGANKYLKDLTDPANIVALEKLIDVEELLLYYAFEMIVNNRDWPNNNFKLWRYKGEQVEGNKYTDNRFRPLLFDMDGAYNHTAEVMDKIDVIETILDNPAVENSFISKMIVNEDYKNTLINRFNDLFATTLKAESVIAVLEQENNMFKRYEENSTFGSLVKTDVPQNRQQNVDEMRNFVLGREQVVREKFDKYFGVDELFSLRVDAPPKGSTISFNSLTRYSNDAKFDGRYYKDIPVKLQANISDGYEFSHWKINGKSVYSQAICINDYVQADSVDVELITIQKNQAKLVVNELSATAGYDWFELYNCGKETIALKNYYVSDDPENLKKCRLPDRDLPGGEYLDIYCKNVPMLFSYTTNFNIKPGETLFITDSSGVIVHKIKVPEMAKTNSYGLYLNTNEYRYFPSPTPGKPNDN